MIKDLFTTPDLIPVDIREVLDKYESHALDGFDYETLAQMLDEVESRGYTFDYYLDAVPYGLRLIGTPIEMIEGYND